MSGPAKWMLPWKLKIASLLTSPAVGRALGWLYKDHIPFHDIVIDTSRHVRSEVKAMLFWRIYESAEARFIRRYLRSDLDVVELGSSLGAVSSLIARRLDHGKRLVCVEADPRLLPIIRNNVLANCPEASLAVEHGAVCYGVPVGTRVAFGLGDNNLAGSIAAECGGLGDVEVPAITLSALLDRHQIQSCALVCDIEGAEAGMIRHDGRGLAACKQVIAELHDAEDAEGRMQVADMVEAMRTHHGFEVCDHYGNVYVFARRSGQG